MHIAGGGRGTDSWLDGTKIDKNFGPDLPLLFKMHKIWSVDFQENYKNWSHQMSDFKAKMHQFDFGWGSIRSGGAYSTPPDSLAGFKEAYF